MVLLGIAALRNWALDGNGCTHDTRRTGWVGLTRLGTGRYVDTWLNIVQNAANELCSRNAIDYANAIASAMLLGHRRVSFFVSALNPLLSSSSLARPSRESSSIVFRPA